MNKKEEEIFQHIAPYYKGNLLTHYYFSTGFLDKTEPEIVVANKETGRFVFDLASLTKPLVIAALFFREFSYNQALYETSIGAFLAKQSPLLLPNPLKKLRIKDLLEHRASVPAWKNLWIRPDLNGNGAYEVKAGSRQKQRELVLTFIAEWMAQVSLYEAPYQYSDLGYILLGFCLELKFGQKLDKIFADFLGSQLAAELFFSPTKAQRQQIVPSAYCRVRRRWLVGEVHDENAYILSGCAGHAGLFASGPALESYLRFLLREGVFTTLKDHQGQRSLNVLGWKRLELQTSKTGRVKTFFGHLGFTGTAFWIDLDTGEYLIFLTNRIVSSRSPTWISDLREKVYQTTFNRT